MNSLIKHILSMGKMENTSHSLNAQNPVAVKKAGSQLQSNSKTQNHFPLQCKDIKDRLKGTARTPRPRASHRQPRSLTASGGDDDRGEAAREERGKRATWRGRADGGVICVGCGRWGKHGCVSGLSDASRSVRNQFRVGLGRHACNN